MIISLERVKNIVTESVRTSGSMYSPKKYAIDSYEKTENIRQCDTAFPIQWHRAVTDHFNGLQNIGNWCWAYGENVHGMPLPTCERALTLFEIMVLNTKCHLVYSLNHVEEEPITT